MLFSIKQYIKKTETVVEIKRQEESKTEKMVEEYLNDTYNLTKFLNKQQESKKSFEWNRKKK